MSSSDEEVDGPSGTLLKGQNLCVGTDLSTSAKQLIRAAGGVATTSVRAGFRCSPCQPPGSLPRPFCSGYPSHDSCFDG